MHIKFIRNFFIIIILIIAVLSIIINNCNTSTDYNNQSSSTDTYNSNITKEKSYWLWNPSNTQSRKYIVGKDIESGVYKLETTGDWGNINYKHDDGTYLYWNIIPGIEGTVHDYNWNIKNDGIITVGGGSGGKVSVTLTKVSD